MSTYDDARPSESDEFVQHAFHFKITKYQQQAVARAIDHHIKRGNTRPIKYNKHEQHWQAKPLFVSPDNLPPAKNTKPEGKDAAANV
jgi:hypothetical protein